MWRIRWVRQGAIMTRLRLASYNVQKAVGTDFRRDPDRVVSVIGALGADVLALQEVDKRLHPRPSPFEIEKFLDETGLEPLPIGGTEVSMGHHGTALLVGPRVTVRETRQLELDGFEPRGAVMADLEIEGQSLRVIGTHLGLLRRSRARQSAELLGHVGDAPRAAILGDMNEWRTRGGLLPLAEAMEVVIPGRSFHARRPLARFDRAALRGMSVEDCGVVRSRLARQASDHLPVWFDVTLTP